MTPAAVISRRFSVSIEREFSPRFNIAPSQSAPIIRVQEAVRELIDARWGFVPHWRRDGSSGPEPINARGETVATSRMFADSFLRRRCIVPASGFYEWARTAVGKRPFFIRPAGDDLFAFAGLWSSPLVGGDEQLPTFTIITCQASSAIAPLHHRMPVILSDAGVDRWLATDVEDTGGLASILVAAAPEATVAHQVSTLVNSPRNDEPGCIAESSDLF